jgi:zinc transporter 1/2/3
MSAFSGGLFFAVGILHLMPEADESYEKYYEENLLNDEEHFPWPSLIVTITFALILFIEKIGPTHQHIEHDHANKKKSHSVFTIYTIIRKKMRFKLQINF